MSIIASPARGSGARDTAEGRRPTQTITATDSRMTIHAGQARGVGPRHGGRCDPGVA